MTERRTATVVGGGLAGLAAATALGAAGWQVLVLERAADFSEVGAGLAITRNGMAALDGLGVGGRTRSVAYETFAAGTRDENGRWLLQLPVDAGGPAVLNRAWGVHRQRLHAVLLAAAADCDLVTGARVVQVDVGDPGGAPASVTWHDGARERTVASDLVVAADGVRSTTRSASSAGRGPGLRYSGFTCWRAVVDDDDCASGSGFAAYWGPSTEFGAVRISDDQVYWYGYFRHPAGQPFADELDAAIARFADWAPEVRAMVASTTPARLLRHDVHHLSGDLRTHVLGRVVLIGDAAHAMLPTMGQGANTALEDGLCVGRLIGEPVVGGMPLRDALAAYDRARRPRCRRIAHRSAQTARFGAHVPGGLRQVLRNAAIRSVPAGPAVAAGTALLRWEAPPQGRAGAH